MLTSLVTAAVLLAAAPAPSTLDRARVHYKGEEYEAAAVAYFRAAGDLSAPDPSARFGLARSLARLGFLASARALFIDIATRSDGDPYRRRALPWLASLARSLEPDDELLGAIVTYGPADLEDAEFEGVRDELYFMLGRAQYDRGELERAIASFSNVGRGTLDYTRAQYLSGVAHTRLWKGASAVKSFKNVLRSQADLRASLSRTQLRRAARWTRRRARLERKHRRRGLDRLQARMQRKGMSFATLDEIQQTRRHDEMASLAMAYVFYQSGQLDLAQKYFLRVPQESPYWLDAIFGRAWTRFLAAYRDIDNENLHYQKALGHIHTLRAPFFPYRLYPETPLLEAEIFYFNCRYRLAALALEEFERRYADVGVALKQVLRDFPEDFGLYQLDRDLQAGRSTLDTKTTAVLEGLLDNKRLDQRRGLVDTLELERDRLRSMSEPFRDGPLGERVAEDIDLAVSAAREAAGKAVRQRLQSSIREIKRHEKNAIKIAYELEPKLVASRGDPKAQQRARPGPDGEFYKYNGEYWQDELGHYNYKITSKCRE